MNRRFFPAIAALLAFAAAVPARADDKALAANFFDAGAEAYDAGQYLVAAEAFLKAHELLKSPALLFSAAQANRRQYLVDASPDALRHAVRLYRDYLRDDPTGNRREDAMSALSDLAPLEARLADRGLVPIPVPLEGRNENGGAADPGAKPAAEPSESPRTTRLLLTAKPEGAEVAVDGAAFVRMPLVIEVKSGPHPVRMRAAGYFDEAFSVEAVEKELVPRHVPMRPKPGRLVIAGTSGARVFVDGQARAILPIAQSLEIEPGEHFISVVRSGREELGRTMTITRDTEAKLDASLPMTGQRIAAWTTFGIGLAGAAAGGVLTGLVLDQDAKAATIEAKRTSGILTPSERDAENAAISARNDYALAASVTGGAAALVFLTSVGLFMFDEPAPTPTPAKRRDEAPGKPQFEFTVGFSSVGVQGRF